MTAASLGYHRVQGIGCGLERIAAAPADHAGKAIQQAQFAQQLDRQGLRLVGDHGNLHPAFVERVQHGRDLRGLAQVGLQRERRPAAGRSAALRARCRARSAGARGAPLLFVVRSSSLLVALLAVGLQPLPAARLGLAHRGRWRLDLWVDRPPSSLRWYC